MTTEQITATTTDQNFPAGTVAGPLRFFVTDAAGAIVADTTSADPTVNIDLPDGTYTPHVQRLDSAGNPLADAVTGEPRTFPEPVRVSIPIPVSIAFAAEPAAA